MSITQSPNHPNQPNHANHFNHANHPNHTNLIITSITPITPITSITLITNCKFFLLHLKNVITSITDGFFSENFWNSWSRQSQLIFLRFFWNTWSRQLRLSFFSQKDLKYVITSNTIHFLWKSPITKSRDYTITKNPKPPTWLASGEHWGCPKTSLAKLANHPHRDSYFGKLLNRWQQTSTAPMNCIQHRVICVCLHRLKFPMESLSLRRWYFLSQVSCQSVR